MALKPWRNVVTPREDLRTGRPLDAAEFAVHLDQVRDGHAPPVYQDPRQFFERTFLTLNLSDLATEVLRRLSGIKTETSAVFNMTTQFGGGKTHALTLLYHLATHGPEAAGWTGVPHLLERAGVAVAPKAAVAVFVGTEFDSISGRGGDDGTPRRRTPWGEIAYQLGGPEALAVLAEHERQMTAPAGDVIRKFLPDDRPCLILMDELINYVSRSRKSGMGAQFYNFLHNLSEVVRGRDNAVLAVSIPASEMEMSGEDQADHERFKKLLDRLGKAIVMSAGAETSEIIRRRLFEWDERAVNQDGRILLPADAQRTCREYADWVVEHRQQLPHWFPADHASDAFAATYPFHPTVLSVFERKWQVLPRFQQTRGVLRLLALWVSCVYQESYKTANRDALIGLGTAPLDDALFRAAVFEQLGESRMEAAVTTDVCGKPDAFALRLDAQADDALGRARLHRKAATAVFFESNGGQARAEATIPEIRLDVGEPDLDIGNVETALETLAGECYYLSVQNNRYRFSVSPNLNKLLADRRASIAAPRFQERVRAEVQKAFGSTAGVERVFFPEKSNDIPDRATLTLAVVAPDQVGTGDVPERVDRLTREAGSSSRTFKSALIWSVPDANGGVAEEARRLLAWEEIDQEKEQLRLDDTQARQLRGNLEKAQRDLREAVWRAYRNLYLLGRDNTMRHMDLGLVHSSAATTLPAFVLTQLRQQSELEDSIGANRLLRSWPPAFTEWSTLAVRNAFFASPQFPRLLNGNVLKDTIAKGVTTGTLAYIGKRADGSYEPFRYNTELNQSDVDLSEDMFIIKADTAEAYLVAQRAAAVPQLPEPPEPIPSKHWIKEGSPENPPVDERRETEHTVASGSATPRAITRVAWEGEVPYRKWMNFYQKVLSGFTQNAGLKVTVRVAIDSESGVSVQKIQDVKVALRELGLAEDIEIST